MNGETWVWVWTRNVRIRMVGECGYVGEKSMDIEAREVGIVGNG